MANSPSNSPRHGSFESLSARLDDMDRRLALASPPPIVMPISRRVIAGIHLDYNPVDWESGASEIVVLQLGVQPAASLPAWRPKTLVVLGSPAILENNLAWTPSASSGSVGFTGEIHPRFYQTTPEVEEGDLLWTSSTPDVDEVLHSHIISLDGSRAHDGRLVVIRSSPNPGFEDAVLRLGVQPFNGQIPPGHDILQESELRGGESATYVYDSQTRTWLLIHLNKVSRTE